MKIALLMLLVVFAAGCTGLSGIFGGDVLNIKQNIIQDGQKDILVVKDVATIPKSPMLPEQSFIFSFLVENVDKAETAKNVVVDLFNAPTVKNQKGDLCNTASGNGCVQENNECTETKKCTILPGEQIPINFLLKTPEKEEIVNIETTPTLDYRVRYDFRSAALYVMPSVNYDEIRKNQKSSDKIDVQITKSYGTGPVRVDMELFGTPYILSGQPATFIFKITNAGSGNVVGSQIDANKLRVEFPFDMLDKDAVLKLPDGESINLENFKTNSEKFSCVTISPGSRIACSNTNPIQMYKDQTRGSLRFEITKTATLSQPFLSYDIRASVDYTYELRGSKSITVKPFEG